MKGEDELEFIEIAKIKRIQFQKFKQVLFISWINNINRMQKITSNCFCNLGTVMWPMKSDNNKQMTTLAMI